MRTAIVLVVALCLVAQSLGQIHQTVRLPPLGSSAGDSLSLGVQVDLDPNGKTGVGFDAQGAPGSLGASNPGASQGGTYLGADQQEVSAVAGGLTNPEVLTGLAQAPGKQTQ